MRVRVQNNGAGPFGVEKVGGGYQFVQPGASKVVDAAAPGRLYELDFLDVEAIDAEVPAMPESLKEKVAPILRVEEALDAELVVTEDKRDPFDHDGDGKPGGSRKGKASTAAKGARRKRRSPARKP